MKNSRSAYDLVLALAPLIEMHRSSNSDLIQKLSDFVDELNYDLLGEDAIGSFDSAEFGTIYFPYYSFGSVKSYFHLEYRELVLFAIYTKILSNYSRFLDIGGNLGLHSILVSKLSNLEIYYVEPDPIHFKEAAQRFLMNGVNDRIQMHDVAASNFEGTSSFVRLNNNTTGSHLSGSKSNVFGPIETFEVNVSKLSRFVPKFGRALAKIDIEGAEVDALSDLSDDDWERFDCVVEITDIQSAQRILQLASLRKLNIFSQKISWDVVSELNELPHRWDQGSVLISRTLRREDFLG